MALSDKAKQYLEYSLANQEVADEVVAALELDRKADSVSPFGTIPNLVGVDGTGSNAAPLTETEGRLDALEAKLNAVIVALKSAGLMK
jgi:hypothetical protein